MRLQRHCQARIWKRCLMKLIGIPCGMNGNVLNGQIKFVNEHCIRVCRHGSDWFTTKRSV